RASKFEGEISVIATPWLERGIETQPMDAFKGGVRGGGGWPGAKAGAPIGGKRLIWVFGIALSSPQIKNISLYQNSDLRYQSAVPGPPEGRFAIVTERWAGDAMDAVASGGLRRARRNACSGRRSRVVLAPRPWRQAGW